MKSSTRPRKYSTIQLDDLFGTATTGTTAKNRPTIAYPNTMPQEKTTTTKTLGLPDEYDVFGFSSASNVATKRRSQQLTQGIRWELFFVVVKQSIWSNIIAIDLIFRNTKITARTYFRGSRLVMAVPATTIVRGWSTTVINLLVIYLCNDCNYANLSIFKAPSRYLNQQHGTNVARTDWASKYLNH